MDDKSHTTIPEEKVEIVENEEIVENVEIVDNVEIVENAEIVGNEGKISLGSEKEVPEEPKTDDLTVEITTKSSTKINLDIFDLESSEEGEKEEEEQVEPYYPYGKDYLPLNSKSIKAIANELGLIRLCWPPKDITDLYKLLHYAESYKENNNKEKLLLLYAENFRKQYQTTFPTKKPLFLAADNECDMQKMVCTTIRPTKVSYPEFYTWKGCGKFISDHIDYIPLENPTSLPTKLVSGETVLLRQAGHSFEMSTLLVSYLLAVGYDAYVVAGYATREYCLNDQSYTNCLITATTGQEEKEEDKTLNTAKEPKYVVKEPRDLRSKFLLMMEQREKDKLQKELDDQMELERQRIEELERPPPDPHYGWRTHSWVLILPGKRNVEEPIFLEPATGVGSSLENSQYLGIESVWNHVNYWINVQSCANGCMDLSFDLKDITCWEHLLAGEPWEWRKTKIGNYAEANDLILQEKHLDMPTSWVSPLLIPYYKYEQRYPKGQKITNYKKAQVELFAPYLQKDGLVSRITIYDDYEYQNPQILYENFNYREDYLIKLTKLYDQNMKIEDYLPGRDDGLKKQTTYIHDHKKEMEFYYSVRYDGLRKVTTDETSMIEEYEDREDRLYYTCVTFKAPLQSVGYRWSLSDGQHRHVVKKVEKFRRNLEIHADKDIAVREFDLSKNEIHIIYHYGEGKVTASTRNFKKPSIADMGDRLTYNPELTSGFLVHPKSPEPKKVELFWLLEESLKAEERALEDTRDMEIEVIKIYRKVIAEIAEPSLFISIFDKERNEEAELGMKERERKLKEKTVREVEAEIDFLAVYMAQLGDQPLTRRNAHIIRQRCLNDYKQLLVDRANRIQQKFDKATELLHAKHDWYENLGINISHEAEDAYVGEVSRIAFYLHTLDIRLVRHRDLATARYLALEAWLQSDLRLAILYSSSEF